MSRADVSEPEPVCAAGSGSASRWGPDETRGDVLALLVAVLLIAVTSLIGIRLNDEGVGLVLRAPPMMAQWAPHLGAGSVLVVACVLAAVHLQRVSGEWPWRRLLAAGWALQVAWMVSLSLIDGWPQGWAGRMTRTSEYLHELPRVGDPLTFLSTFSDHITAGPDAWTTHVAAHPPLATLVYWAADRVGLGGGFWAATLSVLAGSLTAVALPSLLRTLGAEGPARRLVSLVAVFPGAIWMAVSADGMFAGVAVAGLALAAAGAVRHRPLLALAGGVLLAVAVYLNYGLVLFGLVVVTVLVLTVRADRRAARGWVIVVAAALAVAAAHQVAGFSWFEGLAELRIRYYQGAAATRPYQYFVFANLAALLVCCSPVLAVGLRRCVTVLRQARRGVAGEPGAATLALVALSAVAAVLVANLSGMSKGETERIWLPFAVVAFSSLALLRGRAAQVAVIGAAGVAIVVNHLLDTTW